MPLYREIDGKFVQWEGEPINGITYPFNIEFMWSYEALASLGLYRPQEPHPIPDGFEIISTEPKRDEDGYVRYTHKLVPIKESNAVITKDMVDLERDLRITNGVVYENNLFDSDAKSAERLRSYAILAGAAISNGVARGNFYWHHPKEVWKMSQKRRKESRLSPFEWISLDNNRVQLDAFMVIELLQVIADWERLHIFAARKLKDLPIIPSDYQDEVYWP